MPHLPYPVRIRPVWAADRPRYWYEYFVAGRGQFPIDMLRHDLCWPATSEDAAKIVDACVPELRVGRYTVKINSYREPRIGRWESFGWLVVDAVLAEADRTVDIYDALGDENAKGETPLGD
jgi:hypothetical protein